MQKHTPFKNPDVASAYADFPTAIRDRLMELREVIIATADETDGVTGFEEALKWGEPSFVTTSGSTIRVNQVRATEHQYGLYFNCQSKLIETFRALFPTKFHFDGNRALIFDLDNPPPYDELTVCVSLALTYHKRKHLDLLGA